jgi:error-prone DNA polymerase
MNSWPNRFASLACCHFSLDELKYQYPAEVIPEGETPTTYLRRLTYEGAGRRWPAGMTAKVQMQIEHELTLIAELEATSTTSSRLPTSSSSPGRATSSAKVGAARRTRWSATASTSQRSTQLAMHVLFERFISKERGEPPDIDVDFEQQRREEVIQYLYAKYGRHRAALTATVISLPSEIGHPRRG